MTTTPTSGAADLRTAAQAVVDRWDTPLWKDVPATAEYIGRLRAALAAGQATAAQAVVQDDLITLRKPTTSAEMLWLLKLAHLVISDVDKTLEESFATAQPAAQQGVAYAELPEPYCNAHDDADACYPDMFSEHQMHAFADATCALRASRGQAPAGATEEVENLRKALVYTAFALHDTPQYMLAQGITLIDGDTVRVSRDGRTVEASVNPHRQPAPATQQAGERVYAFRRKGLADFCTCDEARYEELSNKQHLFETRIFYTAPQPVARDPLSEQDPLQGAADWLVTAHAELTASTLAGKLSIGYNRAKRLHDAALDAQGGKA